MQAKYKLKIILRQDAFMFLMIKKVLFLKKDVQNVMKKNGMKKVKLI